MIFHIQSNQTVSGIQEDFRKHFPFLKLVFFERCKEEGNVVEREQMIIDLSTTLGKLSKSVPEGKISVYGNMKVGDLEREFHERFALCMQVFRKSGVIWLRTTTTDNRTLDELNNLGAEMNISVTSEPEHDADIY